VRLEPAPAKISDKANNEKNDEGDKTTEKNDAEQGDEKEPQKMIPVLDQPPAQTLEIAFASKDGKFYAKRADAESIYQIPKKLYEKLFAEYHDDRVLTFEESQVVAYSIRQDDVTDKFKLQDGEWVYASESALPLDQKAVKNLLVQLGDLKTAHYVGYAVEDLSQYGLDQPQREVAITLDDGTQRRLLVSAQICKQSPDKAYYASLGSDHNVFLLTPATLKRFEVSIDDLEADE